MQVEDCQQEESELFHKSKLEDWESWIVSRGRMYFVHSFRLGTDCINHLNGEGWRTLICHYAGETFISFVRKGEIMGTQFHPEKSGEAGLEILKRFTGQYPYEIISNGRGLSQSEAEGLLFRAPSFPPGAHNNEDVLDQRNQDILEKGKEKRHVMKRLSREHGAEENVTEGTGESISLITPKLVRKSLGLAKRIIACLDVRELEDGTLTVTKGDQYDVKEGGKIRNLGSPQYLAKSYFNEGIDELVFLSIKSYNRNVLKENSLLQLIQETARHVFVPLCVGGGIRDVIEVDTETGQTTHIPAVDVAAAYFRAGKKPY